MNDIAHGRHHETCPRCGGDMFLETDGPKDEATKEEAYYKCVECHHIEDYQYFQEE